MPDEANYGLVRFGLSAKSNAESKCLNMCSRVLLMLVLAGSVCIFRLEKTLTGEVRHVDRRKTDTPAASASPAMWCTASGEMVHGDRTDGARPPRLRVTL